MRRIAAVIVIILISITSSSANKTLDIDLDDDELPTKGVLKSVIKEKDERTLARPGGCPLCDSSVYPYCDFKIFHDACCCGLRAPQCQFNDCSYLHANSCAEHLLITKCCCYSKDYRGRSR